MSMKNNLIENIRAGMAYERLSIQGLADTSGVHRVHISRILNGHLEPGFDVIEKLADGLHVDPPARLLQINCFGRENTLAAS